MPGYNRVRGVTWPVTFRVADGRLFTVLAPVAGPKGFVLRCRVEGVSRVGESEGEGEEEGEHEIGRYYGEQSAGAVIGRAIREWILRTGEAIAIARRDPP